MEQGRVTYDAEADALYVRLVSRRVARTRSKGDLRMIDYAEDGSVVGVEFLQASGGIDLTGLAESEEIEQLIRQGGLHFPVFA